ncbi:hypothetical protein, partial [Aeromonas rivipollensis]|uniref:hypothetical protein n=1 Tax=Aeromonas rivipollensis TaxID=948519 RepID=UPI00196A0569
MAHRTWADELKQSGHHKKGRVITFCAFYIQHAAPMDEYRTEKRLVFWAEGTSSQISRSIISQRTDFQAIKNPA